MGANLTDSPAAVAAVAVDRAGAAALFRCGRLVYSPAGGMCG